MLEPAFLVIGNPENRRVGLFQADLLAAGHQAARLLSWIDLLSGRSKLSDWITPTTIIRVESPGENFRVEQLILAKGGIAHADALPDERGRIYHPRQWFAGFSGLMDELAATAGESSWFNHPHDILTMFDKPGCKRLLPDALPPLPAFDCADQFFDFAATQARPRFFIKLNYSSSASGVVAWEQHRRTGQERAFTTMELVETPTGPRFYNSLRIRKLTRRPAIRPLLDFLFRSGALVEPWIPKARHQDQGYDLRVLAIGGKRRHAIARLSRSPLTNLHLGNQRCPVEDLELDDAQWAGIDGVVERTMKLFPRSLYAGLDILLPQGGGAPVLLEANAFGDLLPNLLEGGQSTYAAEIAALGCRRPVHA